MVQKNIFMIGNFGSSSKICNVCEYHNSELTLKDKYGKFPDCKTKYGRGINSASNIKIRSNWSKPIGI